MKDMLYLRSSFTNTYPIEESDICFVGVPFDSTALAEGNQRFGPVTVRQAIRTNIGYIKEKGKNPLNDLKISDLGNLEWVPGSFEKTSERLRDTINSIYNVNSEIFFVFIGGEHSVTLPIVEEIKPKTIVQLDAHLDRAKDYHGKKYAHNTWARYAEDQDIEIIQVGCRNWSENEEGEKNYMNIQDRIDEIQSAEEPVYLTVDMDVFDPAYAPQVGYPEEGGFKPEEVFRIIDETFTKEVVGMDICEISSKSLNNRTSVLAAKTILRSIASLC